MTRNDGMRIEARRLAFGYPGRRVGEGADLAIGAGEVFCLLGPNGCGKTTLFKTLIGLLPKRAGDVLIGGRAIETLSRRDVARAVAYVPQAQNAPFAFSVMEMALMGRVAHRPAFAAPSRRDREIVHEALAALGVADLAERDFTKLSGGQRQLVLIARALAQASPLIVMDEPTASLDFGNQARVIGRIRQLAENGVGVVLSTHDPDHAFAVASRVALMRGGDILAIGAPHDVLTQDRLRDVYGVRVTIGALSGGQTVCAPDYAAGDQP